MMLGQSGKRLLRLARDSITLAFEDTEPGLGPYGSFLEPRGVFVTLKKDGHLRGCIGFPLPEMPLAQAVAKAARSAAFEDPRFPPLRKEELDAVSIGISVLTVPEKLDAKEPGEYLRMIKVGKDGLIIRTPAGSGLLLPQVPVEQGWDTREFLEHLCMKAGLAAGAWKEPEAEIHLFQAEIFSE